MFDPMHAIHVRPPYEVKVFGHPDKPYVLEWDYMRREGQYMVKNRRHLLASREKALDFAIKHQILRDRLPVAIRRRLCEYAQTVEAIKEIRCTK